MSVPAAFTKHPEDSNLLDDRFSVDKINDAAAIVSMNPAVGRRAADRTCFSLRAKGIHVRIEQNF